MPGHFRDWRDLIYLSNWSYRRALDAHQNGSQPLHLAPGRCQLLFLIWSWEVWRGESFYIISWYVWIFLPWIYSSCNENEKESISRWRQRGPGFGSSSVGGLRGEKKNSGLRTQHSKKQRQENTEEVQAARLRKSWPACWHGQGLAADKARRQG